MKQLQNNNSLQCQEKNSLTYGLRKIDFFSMSEGDLNMTAMSMFKVKHEDILHAPKVFQLEEKDVIQSLCVLLKVFNFATKVKTGLYDFEIIAVAEEIAKTYTHDSVDDVALAFKEALTSGWRPREFGILHVGDVMTVISEYFERKALRLEQTHKSLRDSNKSLIGGEIGALAEGLTSNSVESFTEKYDRERRERVARELKAWRLGLEEQENEGESI